MRENKPVRHVFTNPDNQPSIHKKGDIRYFTPQAMKSGGPRRNGWVPKNESKSAEDKPETQDKPVKRKYTKKTKE